MAASNFVVGGSFPTFHPTHLPVCRREERRIDEYDIVNSKLETRCTPPRPPIVTIDDFVSAVKQRAQQDCVTVYEAVNLHREYAIRFEPHVQPKHYAQTLVTKLLHAAPKFLVYSLPSLREIEVAFAEKVVPRPSSDEGDQWANFLRDPGGLDAFLMRQGGKLHARRWNKVASSVAVVSSQLARRRWRDISETMLSGRQLFLDKIAAIDALLCARFYAVARGDAGYRAQILKSDRDGKPTALFIVPSRWETTAAKELQSAQNAGIRWFIPLCKALHSRHQWGTVFDGVAYSGFARFLIDFDWTQINACVYDPEETQECELAAECLPPRFKRARCNPSPLKSLVVGFRHKCLSRSCPKRFRNVEAVVEHLRTEHKIKRDDIPKIRAANDHSTANKYRFFDERQWLGENQNLTTEAGCRASTDIAEKTSFFVAKHQENVTLLQECENDILRLDELIRKHPDSDTLVPATLDSWRATLEYGKSVSMPQDEFRCLYSTWLKVLELRTAELNHVGDFLSRQRHELLESEIIKTFKAGVDNYYEGVRRAGGSDFTHLSESSLLCDLMPSLNAASELNKTREGGFKTSLLTARLLENQTRRGVADTVKRLRQQGSRQYGGDDDDDDKGEKRSNPEQSAVPTSVIKRRRVSGGGEEGPVQVHRLSGPKVSLAVLRPELIKVNAFDVWGELLQIVTDIFATASPTENQLRQRIQAIVRFLTRAFGLSEAGVKYVSCHLYQFEQELGQMDGGSRNQALYERFALIFRFLNCNDTNRLDEFFSSRHYASQDPFQSIVEIDNNVPYRPTVGQQPLMNDRRAIEALVSDVERFRGKHAQSGSVVCPACKLGPSEAACRRLCGVCLEPFNHRPLEAIPCESLRLATSMKQSDPSFGDLIKAAADRSGDWNGAHLFHKSCLQQWIRSVALDPEKNTVNCPKCQTIFYGEEGLNAVRCKLFKLGANEWPTDSVFNVKSALNRAESFLIEIDAQTLRENVKKQLHFQKSTSRLQRRKKTATNLYDFRNIVLDYFQKRKDDDDDGDGGGGCGYSGWKDNVADDDDDDDDALAIRLLWRLQNASPVRKDDVNFEDYESDDEFGGSSFKWQNPKKVPATFVENPDRVGFAESPYSSSFGEETYGLNY